MKLNLVDKDGDRFDYEAFRLDALADSRHYRNQFNTNPYRAASFYFEAYDDSRHDSSSIWRQHCDALVKSTFPEGIGLHGKDDSIAKKFFRVFDKAFNLNTGVLSSDPCDTFYRNVEKLLTTIVYDSIAASLNRGIQAPTKIIRESFEDLDSDQPAVKALLEEWALDIPSSELIVKYNDPLTKSIQEEPIDMAFLSFQADSTEGSRSGAATFTVIRVKYNANLESVITEYATKYLRRHFAIDSCVGGIPDELLLQSLMSYVSDQMKHLALHSNTRSSSRA